MSAILNRRKRRQRSEEDRDAILQGEQFHVRFFHRDDRYAHVISLRHGEEVVPLLESFEGSPEDYWPASPALQSLHVQQNGDGQLAMLVGMAGRSHWSAAVELATHDGMEVLTFDVACRVHSPAVFLGSSYRTADGLGDEAQELRSPAGVCQLKIGDKRENRTRRLTGDGKLSFGPHEQDDEPPTTRRWTYSLQCSHHAPRDVASYPN